MTQFQDLSFPKKVTGDVEEMNESGINFTYDNGERIYNLSFLHTIAAVDPIRPLPTAMTIRSDVSVVG